MNTSGVALSENLIHRSKMKHMEIDMFFINEEVHSWEIIVNFVPTNEPVIDILLKPLTKKSFVPCSKKLGVFSVEDMPYPTTHLHTKIQVPL